VAGVEGECTNEDVKLSRLITEISDALVDMGVFPIRDIPQRPMLAQDVLTIVGLILDHLREEQSSSVGPWP
jgi:5-carboxymethyl-2-hydroxymuconate isomerase